MSGTPHPTSATSSSSAPASSAAAIARDAGRHRTCRWPCVEARDDVGDGTSKANTAILHTGFDATPGTLESRLVARGYDLLGDYAEQTGIPVERTGALLVAWTDEELDALPGLKDKAERNGYHALRDRRRRRGVPARPRPRPGRAGRADRARRVDHLHLDHQPRAGHRRRRARARAAARRAGDAVPSPSDGHTTLQHHPRRRPRPLGRQRRRARAPTTSTPSSATTASPSPRAAANCSSSTSWPGRWCRASCWPCRRRAARGCWSARPSTAT